MTISSEAQHIHMKTQNELFDMMTDMSYGLSGNTTITLNINGGINLPNGRTFESKQALHNWLIDVSTKQRPWIANPKLKSKVEVLRSVNSVDHDELVENRFHISDWPWVFELMFEANCLIFEYGAPLSLHLQRAIDIECHTIEATERIMENSYSTIPRRTKDIDDNEIYLNCRFPERLTNKHIESVMSLPVFNFALENYWRRIKKEVDNQSIDKDVLVEARPDLAVFVAGYPLPKATAEMLRTILAYIEVTDLAKLNKVLEPLYTDAVRIGRIPKAQRGELSSLATCDDVHEDMQHTLASLSDRLPTVKEILQKRTIGFTFE